MRIAQQHVLKEKPSLQKMCIKKKKEDTLGQSFKQSLTKAAASDNQWASKSVNKWFVLSR